MTASRVLLAIVATASIASAQPAPQGKDDARSLLQTGLRMLEASDYLGALAVFQDAYRRFPSAKLLINIGTTQMLLARKADAANSYQRYLDSTDADPSRRAEVSAALRDLDAAVGRLEITVQPPDAEIRVGEAWIPAASAEIWRVEPGAWKVEVRRVGYSPDERTGSIAAGASSAATIALAEIKREQTVAKQRSRVGALATEHISIAPRIGSAWLLGATADVTQRIGLDLAVLLGPGLISDGMATLAPPSFGGYFGASFRFRTGTLRPRIGVGVPVFASDGARVFLRAGGGIEYVASRHVSFLADLGAEIGLNAQSDIRTIAFVPAFGLAGRL
jgi:hypothetical protein